MQGWIKLHRRLTQWEWYDDINTSRLFIHILLKANHADKNWKGIEIKRGQMITSLDRLITETKLTKSQIRTCLKKLISTREIAHSGKAQHTVITVINYDSYQGDGTQDDTALAHESHSNDTALASNKNVKNDNNDKKEDYLVLTKSEPSKKFKFDDDDMKLAIWMFDRVIVINPSAKKPNLESWANTIRLMRTVNKYELRQISETFDWANRDSFWCSNILSPAKLRGKWDQLNAKRLNNHEGRKQHQEVCGQPTESVELQKFRAAKANRGAGGRRGVDTMGNNDRDVLDLDSSQWSGTE